MSSKKKEIVKIFEAIFASQERLRQLAPEFNWAGLGNLLGDYGEYLALNEYGLTKASAGSESYDAVTNSGLTVQIKANFSAKQIGFRGSADLLLVLGIDSKGEYEEIYYGPFDVVQKVATYSTRDSKWMIGVTKLKAMNKQKTLA